MAGYQTKGSRHAGRAEGDGRPTKTDHRERVSAGRSRDRELEAAHKAGLAGDEPPHDDKLTPYYQDGVKEAKRLKATKRRGQLATTAKRKGRRARRSVTRDAKRLAPAAAAQAGSGLRLAGMTLGLVGLYLVLTNVDTFQGVMGSLARAVSWLSDPGTSIPYNKER